MHVGEGGGEKGACVGGKGGRVHVCVCCGGRGGKGEKGGEKEGGKFKVHICRCGILTIKITVLLPSHFW